jgi:hypothetical protein
MNATRIALYIVIGVGYALFAPPEHPWLSRLALLVVAAAVYWVTRLLFGKDFADSDPLAAEPVPSLRLSERALENARRERG